ncbi:hypothetical protein V2I28_08175 [Campylobacter sp. CX2-4080-23]|uniref:hypothetical protein n=1 Tax=Campylobacter porcelli TaxID=1660073 RepID=UPI002EA0622C|nr:hypothetical protein [Campylobacter sp. CX2-4080-23]
MDKFVVSSRNDGSGGRLICLINTIAIANMLNIDFRFCWGSYQEVGGTWGPNFFGDDKVRINGMSMGSVKDIFDEKFIANHYIDKELGEKLGEYNTSSMSSNTLDSQNPLCYSIHKENNFISFKTNFLQDEIKKFALVNQTSDYAKHFCFDEKQSKEYKNELKNAFNTIGFNQNIKNIINKAKSLATKYLDNGGYSVLHFRAGDIVHTYSSIRLFGKEAIYKATNPSLALHILKNSKDKIILCSDDITTSKELIKIANNPNVIFVDDLRETRNNIEAFYFDIIIMSMAKRLFGSLNSQMSRLCALINPDLAIKEIYEIFSPSDQLQIIKETLPDLKNIPQSCLAFVYFHKYILESKLNLGLNSVILNLNKAFLLDPLNFKYKIYEIKHLIQDGKLEMAEYVARSSMILEHNSFISILLKKLYYGYTMQDCHKILIENTNLNYLYLSYMSARILYDIGNIQCAKYIVSKLNTNNWYINEFTKKVLATKSEFDEKDKILEQLIINNKNN